MANMARRMLLAESRFRDRRGREHYDNGRFAPMRGVYDPQYYPEPVHSDEMSYRRLRPIGFAYPESRWDERREAERKMSGGRVVPLHGRDGHYGEKFDRHMAEEWMAGIRSDDGKQGPRWTEEQTRQVAKQRGIDCDPIEFWVAMNVIYSDYGKVLAKYGMGDRVEVYAELAKAFVDDKDAVENKLARYYECIVER